MGSNYLCVFPVGPSAIVCVIFQERVRERERETDRDRERERDGSGERENYSDIGKIERGQVV